MAGDRFGFMFGRLNVVIVLYGGLGLLFSYVLNRSGTILQVETEVMSRHLRFFEKTKEKMPACERKQAKRRTVSRNANCR